MESLFKDGRGGFVYPLRYLFVVREGSGVAVLTGVPKKLHKRAVRRNLLKRRMREAYRLQCAALEQRTEERGVKVALALMYGTKDVVDYGTISDAVERILEQVGLQV